MKVPLFEVIRVGFGILCHCVIHHSFHHAGQHETYKKMPQEQEAG